MGLSRIRMRVLPLRFICLGMLLASVPLSSQERRAGDWSRFRGPNGSGVADTAELPTEFDPGKNVVWKSAVAARSFLTRPFRRPRLCHRLRRRRANDDSRSTARPDASCGGAPPRGGTPWPSTNGIIRRPRRRPSSRTTSWSSSRMSACCRTTATGASAGAFRWVRSAIPTAWAPRRSSPANSSCSCVTRTAGRSCWPSRKTPGASGGESSVRNPGPAIRHQSSITPANGPAQLLVPGSFALTAYALSSGEKLWWVNGLAFEMKATPVVNDDMVFIHGTSSANFRTAMGKDSIIRRAARARQGWGRALFGGGDSRRAGKALAEADGPRRRWLSPAGGVGLLPVGAQLAGRPVGLSAGRTRAT